MTTYSRRILLVALGTTPHLATATLCALYKTHPDEMPTEIHVVTTRLGADCARTAYLDPDTSLLTHFWTTYGLPPAAFDASHIHTIPGADGLPLADIRTPDDNSRAADFIVKLIRDFCADPNASLHVSIVGGRKSMGLLLGSAMTFYGRDQDRLSHVLSQMESAPGDYHCPTPQELEADPSLVSLGEIPFLRLRPVLPQALVDEQYSFVDVVEASQTQLTHAPKVRLCAVGRRWQVRAENVILKAEKRSLALFIWLMLRTKLGRQTPTSFGAASYEHLFFLRLQFVNILEHFLTDNSWQKASTTYLGITIDRLKEISRRLMHQGIQDPVQYCQCFTAQLTEDEKKKLSTTAVAFSSKLSTLRSKFNESAETQLNQVIPDITHRRVHPYLIDSSEQKDACVYRLRLTPDNIEVPDTLLAELTRGGDAAQYWRQV